MIRPAMFLSSFLLVLCMFWAHYLHPSDTQVHCSTHGEDLYPVHTPSPRHVILS